MNWDYRQAAARHLAAQTRHQGHRDARGRGTRRRARRGRHDRLEPRRARRRQRPADNRQPARKSPQAFGAAFRCSSMAAFAAAPTSSRRSRSARMQSDRPALYLGSCVVRAGRRRESPRYPARASCTLTMRQAGTRSIAEINAVIRGGQPARLAVPRPRSPAEVEIIQPPRLSTPRGAVPRRQGKPMLLAFLAFLGGVLTILSPCVLPVLPFVFARSDQPFARAPCRCCSAWR